MSVRMKLTFASPTPEEQNKKFIDDDYEDDDDDYDDFEERKAAFMQDEELMRETRQFVSELIETATIEASKRMQHRQKSEEEASRKFRAEQTITDWNNRAKGFCNRVWNAIRPRINNNELLSSWATPLRHRFTKP